MDQKTRIKAIIFESLAIALVLFMGAYMGKIATELPPFWAFCAFFWFSYGLNYLSARIFKAAEHWFLEVLSSPPVFAMVAVFCLNVSAYIYSTQLLMLTVAVFLALTLHFYEAIIKIHLRGR